MKILLLFLIAFSLPAQAKDSKESLAAAKLYKQAEKAKLAEDAKTAKKLFEELVKKYPGAKLTDSDKEDDAQGERGDYDLDAKKELEFLDAEIAEGKKRAFTDEKKLLVDLLAAVKSGDKKKIASLAWVEMFAGPCESEADRIDPDSTAAMVLTRAGGPPEKIKQVRMESTPKSRLTVSTGAAGYLELGLTKRKAGWVWNHLTYCSEMQGLN
jgi:hypothetical protein